MRNDRYRNVALIVRHRLRAAAWWRLMMIRYPGGVVPSYIAARMLAVSPQYVWRMGRAGRLTRIEPPPAIGGPPLYSVDEILQLGTPLERGRPREWQWERDGQLTCKRSHERAADWGSEFVKRTIRSGETGTDADVEKNFADAKPLWQQHLP